MEPESGLDLLTIIAARKYKDGVLRVLLECECHLVSMAYAKGSVASGYFRDMLGLMPEEKKVLFTCLAAREQSDGILRQLVARLHFDQPDTGIAFVVPVDKLSV